MQTYNKHINDLDATYCVRDLGPEQNFSFMGLNGLNMCGLIIAAGTGNF